MASPRSRAVGWFVFLAAMGVCAQARGIEITPIMGIPSIETGVFGGIIVGLIAARAFNRFYQIQLPSYLGFFAGKRSVPIITSAGYPGRRAAQLYLAADRERIKGFSNWAAHGQPALAFTIYGVVERALIPFGLHHVWNVPFFFQAGDYHDPKTGKVVHGEITRFIAGDPTAGNMTGGYLFKMWGLPAAALAIWRAARPENRAKIGGIMVSAALTSFLTGITEPIEFAFLFVAPVLYGVHALLAGAAYSSASRWGSSMGSLFRTASSITLCCSRNPTHALWLFVIGPDLGLLYYGVFSVAIRKFNLATPGPRSGGRSDA